MAANTQGKTAGDDPRALTHEAAEKRKRAERPTARARSAKMAELSLLLRRLAGRRRVR